MIKVKNMKSYFTILALAFSSFLPSALQSADQVKVFEKKEKKYTVFRIPSMIYTSKNSLLAFAEARKGSGGDHSEIDLVMKRSLDHGKTWSELTIIHNDGKHTIGNPTILEDKKKGRLFMIFCRNNKEMFSITSDDDGKTWSEKRNLGKLIKPDGKFSWIAAGPGRGLQISAGPHAGRLVFPLNMGTENKHETQGLAMFSDDAGETWKIGAKLPKGTNEVQLAEGSNGQLIISARMQVNRELTKGYRGLAISKNGGESWGDLFHSNNLPCPRCQGCIIKSGDKIIQSLPWYQDLAQVKQPKSSKARRNLSLFTSPDMGKTWTRQQIFTGPSAYSCLVKFPDGTTGVLFEGGVKNRYEALIFHKTKK